MRGFPGGRGRGIEVTDGARLAGPAMIGLGVAVTVLAVARGDAHVAWVLIVPVIYGASPLLLLGTVLWFLGLGVWIAGATISGADGSSAGPARGVVLIGPVPIVFGDWGRHRRWVYGAALVAGVVVFGVALGVAFGLIP